MIKQLAIATAMLSLLAACASEPTVQTGEDAEVVMGNLHKVDTVSYTHLTLPTTPY